MPLFVLLTRQQYTSHSGLQAGAGTRRRAQARVIPLPRSLQCIHALATLGHPVQRAGTQVRRLPEAPNPMIFKDTPRLNTIYSVAGLIALLFLVAAIAPPLQAADDPAVTLRVQGATVLAIEPATGRPRWRYESDAALFDPVQAGGQVFLSGRSGVLRTLDARDGALRWTLTTGDDWIYPPLPFGDRLIVVGRHSGLHALASADGRELWRAPLAQEPTDRPVAISARHALVALFNGDLLAFDADTGRLSWRAVLSSPALNIGVGAGRILFGGYDHRLRAADASDGRLLWTRSLPGRVALPPVVRGKTAIVVTDERIMALADPLSGTIRQRLRIPGDAYAILGAERDHIDLFIRNGNKAGARPVSIAANVQ